MKALVTGADSFVGSWLCQHLENCGETVVRASRSEGFDITNPWSVKEIVKNAEPDAIFHCAEQDLVGQSWKDPADTFEINATGTLYLLDAALSCNKSPKILLLSTADVYGQIDPSQLPVIEDHPMAPVSPFAVSKVSAEYLGLQAHLGTKLHVVRARAFNHIGPNQPAHFVAPSLINRIIKARSTTDTELLVGNIDIKRDYVDIRDAVRAYKALIESGVAGAAYNVCSGREVSVRQIAEQLLKVAKANLDLVVDSALVRRRELSIIGDNSLLRSTTGWSPEIKLSQTLLDMWQHRQQQTEY